MCADRFLKAKTPKCLKRFFKGFVFKKLSFIEKHKFSPKSNAVSLQLQDADFLFSLNKM